jgi:hypothetical protein
MSAQELARRLNVLDHSVADLVAVSSATAIREIADTAATVEGLTVSLVEATARKDALAVLLALTAAGSALRDLASGLYVGLAGVGEGA